MTTGSQSPRFDDGEFPVDSVATTETGLDCRIEEYDGHAECTLFPADLADDDLVTTWVTATDDDAFVDLATVR